MLYKLAIDIHETYGKVFGYPLFAFYRTQVLPLAAAFYRKVDFLALSEIIIKLKRFSQHSPRMQIQLVLPCT